MSVPVFWSPTLGDSHVLVLDGPEGHHAAAVRRVQVGERVRVTDGHGSYVEGLVAVVGDRSVEVAVDRRESVPVPQPRLTVVQALPKRERAQLTVQALVEVGVDRVVPWASERSQVRVTGERGERLVARWRAWAAEAGKQARRSWFCEVADLAATAEVTQMLADADVGLVLHEEADDPLGGVSQPSAGEVVLVIGPEGGLGEAELAALGVATSSSGALRGSDASSRPRNAPLKDAVRAVRLGDTVLRTSTAGAVAAGVVLAQTRWRSATS